MHVNPEVVVRCSTISTELYQPGCQTGSYNGVLRDLKTLNYTITVSEKRVTSYRFYSVKAAISSPPIIVKSI